MGVYISFPPKMYIILPARAAFSIVSGNSWQQHIYCIGHGRFTKNILHILLLYLLKVLWTETVLSASVGGNSIYPSAQARWGHCLSAQTVADIIFTTAQVISHNIYNFFWYSKISLVIADFFFYSQLLDGQIFVWFVIWDIQIGWALFPLTHYSRPLRIFSA